MTRRAPRPGQRRPAATPSRHVDSETEDWRERTLVYLRACIEKADPAAIEEVKWRKPSNPDGVPVWSHDGIVCVGNVLKNAVRLTFPKGARVRDPHALFNTRLDSQTVRAIDVHEGEPVNERALIALVRAAVALNVSDRA